MAFSSRQKTFVHRQRERSNLGFSEHPRRVPNPHGRRLCTLPRILACCLGPSQETQTADQRTHGVAEFRCTKEICTSTNCDGTVQAALRRQRVRACEENRERRL